MHCQKIFCILLFIYATAAQEARRKACKPVRLANGAVVTQGRRYIKFNCNKGYQLIGEKMSECVRGQWSAEVPFCIKFGCEELAGPDNGVISYPHKKASLMLACLPNYEIAGSSISYCNGTHWDRALGSCRETGQQHALSCDFETESLCGWTHDPDSDFDFHRSSGYTKNSVKVTSGPPADHTIGKPYEGHYMVVNENSDPFMKSTILMSPIYNKSYSENGCFKFHYFAYSKSLSSHLRIYIRPMYASIDSVVIDSDLDIDYHNTYLLYETEVSQKFQWQMKQVPLKSFDDNFQIIIEAAISNSRVCAIAIDDVELLNGDDCKGTETEKNETILTDDDAVFNVQSCEKRCFDLPIENSKPVIDHVRQCDCFIGCEEKQTCCPDFLSVCFPDKSENSTKVEEVNSTTKQTTENDFHSITTENMKSSQMFVITLIHEPEPTEDEIVEKTTSSSFNLPSSLSTEKSSVSSSSKINSTTSSMTRSVTVTVPMIEITTKNLEVNSSSSSIPKSTVPIQVSTESSTVKLTSPITTSTTKSIKIFTNTKKLTTSSTIATTTSTIKQTKKSSSTTPRTLATSTPISTKKSTTKSMALTSTTLKKVVQNDILDNAELTNKPHDQDDSEETVMDKNLSPATVQKQQNSKVYPVLLYISITLIAGFVIITIVVFSVKQYKKTTNPMNYKNNGKKSSNVNANDEFSEVRYLTGDEALDFTLLTPERV